MMKLTQQQLETHLWGAANILRGKTAGQDYKNYILSLMFYKRLCDQWEHEADEAIAELEKQQGRAFTETQKAIFRARGEHRYDIPEGSRWGDVLGHAYEYSSSSLRMTRAQRRASSSPRPKWWTPWCASLNHSLATRFTTPPLQKVGSVTDGFIDHTYIAMHCVSQIGGPFEQEKTVGY